MSDVQRLILKQGTQHRGKGYSLGFVSLDVRPEAEGGGLTARIGISGAGGRTSVRLAEGDSAELPTGGSLRLAALAISPDGTSSAASLEITDSAGSGA
ncbi:hypothetical protein [Microbacterium sp. P05]|uniref:hypothetical protein n=1 Tax=Microbacterium sp. P05 TaxID=3366948 RepID=UPI003745E9D0